jgi:hypothetical protein
MNGYSNHQEIDIDGNGRSFLDTLLVVFTTHALYWYTITNFDNPAALVGKIIWCDLLSSTGSKDSS